MDKYYLIKVSIMGNELSMPSTLSRDDFDGFRYYHSAFKGGAVETIIRQEGKGWISQKPGWRIISVKELTRAGYLAALKAL